MLGVGCWIEGGVGVGVGVEYDQARQDDVVFFRSIRELLLRSMMDKGMSKTKPGNDD